MNKHKNEFNDVCLVRFKFSCETIILVDGDHIFTSEKMLMKDIVDVPLRELSEEKYKTK